MTTEHRNHDEPGRLDLSPLAPGGSAARLEALVRGVMAATAPELARRRVAPSLWDLLAQWRRPVLLGAAALAAAAVVVLLQAHPPGNEGLSLAEAGGVPDEWAAWTRAGRNPTPGELLALERGTR
jgi:hypothetical protein